MLPKKEDCSNDLDDDCSGKVNDGCPCDPGKSYACYDGPPATKGVGDCRSGTAVCNAEGMSLGPCHGEVAPKSEDFAAPGDENCDGVPSADTSWVVIAGTMSGYTALVNGVAADAAGDVYVAGVFSETLKIGTRTLDDPGGSAGFLARLDASGSVVWAKSFPGFTVATHGLAFDESTSRILLAGTTLSGADLGASTGPVPPGVVVAAFDSSGDAKWSTACASADRTTRRR